MKTIARSRYSKSITYGIFFFVMITACYKPAHNIDVQGHRGARGLYPENTTNGFLLALGLGVTTLELDVVISQDGQVVVSHEPVLNPEICLDPNGQPIAKEQGYNLYQMAYDSIAKCDCGSKGNPRFLQQQLIAEHKPLLADVVDAVKARCVEKDWPLPHFNVEIKASPEQVGAFHPAINVFADLVVAQLQSALPQGKFNIQSFDVATLQYVQQVYPDVQLAYLQEGIGFKTAAALEKDFENLGFTPHIYSCQYTMLTQDLVNYLHDKNVRVIPWTVNEPDTMKVMLNLGVDGIITDYPDRLLKVLGV